MSDGSRGVAGAAGAVVAVFGGISVYLISSWMEPSASLNGPDGVIKAATGYGLTAQASDGAGEALLVGGLTLLTGLLACVVVVLLSPRSSLPSVQHSESSGALTGRLAYPADRPVVVTPPQPPDPRLAEREKMVRKLAELVGTLPPEYAWQAANVLESAGVQQILADGKAFDSAVHNAVGTESTRDAALHDVVARTVKPGWIDRGRVVVPARVVVYVDTSQPGVLP
jgi:GrpE protein